MTTQSYREASRHLLAQARIELAAGDVRQALEKGWGAAAQILKAVAEQRGWDHGKHRHLSRVASRLRAELGDRDVFRLYMVADSLHGNFYEDELQPEDVAEALETWRRSWTSWSRWSARNATCVQRFPGNAVASNSGVSAGRWTCLISSKHRSLKNFSLESLQFMQWTWPHGSHLTDQQRRGTR